MFEYSYYDKKIYNTCNDLSISALPDSFLKITDIEAVRVSCWGEHCLECGAPECYDSCEMYEARQDQRCRRFVYGMWYRNDAEDVYGIDIRLKKWAKLRTIIRKASIEPDKSVKLDRITRRLGFTVRIISNILSPVIKNYKLSRGVEWYKGKIAEYMNGTNADTDIFLFHAYLYGRENRNMMVEVNVGRTPVFKTSMHLTPGWNEKIIDLKSAIDKVDSSEQTSDLILYQEGNEELEIHIGFCDIVKLRKNMKHKYPAAKVKCVIWDLDRTLWNGILIESSPDELELREGVLTTLKSLDERGIIQAVVSKNNYDEAADVLKRLGVSEYFVALMINWNPKSDNIIKLEEMLNINRDTFAFIDDSIYERKEVSSVIENIRVYDETMIPGLLDFPEFDVIVTEDSKNRRKMYQTEAARNRIKTEYKDNLAFLRQCSLCSEVKKLETRDELNRSYELINRTNQLNLSGKRYSFDDFCERNEKSTFYIVRCWDQYGDYGQIAVIHFAVEDDRLIVDEFAMSCRVARKYVESALLNYFMDEYDKKGITMIGANNRKNKLLIETLKEIGFKDKSNSEETLRLEFSDGMLLNSDIVKIQEKADTAE